MFIIDQCSFYCARHNIKKGGRSSFNRGLNQTINIYT